MDYKGINDYEVLYLIKERDDGAFDLLLQKYLPIIKSIAKRYFAFAKNRGAEYDDLVQEGYLGLNNAICSYREDGSSLFYSYASLCIERQISLYCRALSSKKHEILSMAISGEDYAMDTVVSKESNPENILLDSLVVEDFSNYNYSLELENSCIFELRFNGFSYQEISELLELPITTIDGRLCKMRRNFRQRQKNFV